MSAAPSERTRVRRAPARAVYDREAVEAILDEAQVAHLGFAVDGQPYVIPTLHARVGDLVYVHGSSASRALRTLRGGAPMCLTVTLVDGLVLARSVFHHSMNYRSVVVLGEARAVDDREEKLRALEAFTEGLIPGRWAEARPPSDQELKGTQILALPIDEASAKVRTGGPVDDDEDYALDVWAGVLPLALRAGALEPDDRLRPGVAPSAAVTGLAAAKGGGAGA
ncbi:MAG TPA: pyridoxamine 5'-phosphate oxidase family protein [Baekduia sp.]|nr:pyridoxamine 5'-phosphate oxidase family protein [Baekduia sp.]